MNNNIKKEDLVLFQCSSRIDSGNFKHLLWEIRDKGEQIVILFNKRVCYYCYYYYYYYYYFFFLYNNNVGI